MAADFVLRVAAVDQVEKVAWLPLAPLKEVGTASALEKQRVSVERQVMVVEEQVEGVPGSQDEVGKASPSAALQCPLVGRKVKGEPVVCARCDGGVDGAPVKACSLVGRDVKRELVVCARYDDGADGVPVKARY